MQKININAEDEKIELISAEEFYKQSMASQRRIINEYIEVAIKTGKTEIKLPFKAYEKIDQEMEELGWECDTWIPDDGLDEQCSIYYIDTDSIDDDYDEDEWDFS